MIGHPKHVAKVIDAGVDVVIAQGGEGGGHTGDIPFSVLIPSVVDSCRGKVSKLGRPIPVIAAGGVFDGRGLASALMFGAEAVWVGTRFVASVEANAPMAHKKQVLSTGFDETTRTVIYSGRPMRVKRTPYVAEWNDTRAKEIEELTSKGIIPHVRELENRPERSMEGKVWIMGTNASVINDIPTAKEIVDRMVTGAKEAILSGARELTSARL